MGKLFFTLILLTSFIINNIHGIPFKPLTERDVTIFGMTLCYADACGRIPIAHIDCLQNLSINYVDNSKRQFKDFNFTDMPAHIANIIKKGLQKDWRSKVVLVEHPLFLYQSNNMKMGDWEKAVLDKSQIKIACCMLETDSIPEEWVSLFNQHFDLVVVPDQCLVNVYQNAGVLIPIFVLPIPLYLDQFFDQPPKNYWSEDQKRPFVFGMSAQYSFWKNHLTVISAFAELFGNSKDFYLKLHGRCNDAKIFQGLQDEIKRLGLTNVELLLKQVVQSEFIEFLSSVDCYLLLSKGEGFSITPREAMARGIPCILSNNSAHRTICDTGLVIPVKSELKTPAYYSIFGKYVGNCCDVDFEDAKRAMQFMYDNYKEFVDTKTDEGREWVKQYQIKNLSKRYVNLVKPKKIYLGEINDITDDYFMTNSVDLYNKYRSVFKK